MKRFFCALLVLVLTALVPLVGFFALKTPKAAAVETAKGFAALQRFESVDAAKVEEKLRKLELKRLRFVAQKEGRAPWLFLAEGKRGAKPGVRVEPQLVLQNVDGSDTAEMAEIFGDYRNG